MSDWKYEINDGLVAFYENGIERNIDKVFDTLNAAEARIAELELGLNNQTVHSNTLQKILTEKLDRIAELEAERRWVPVSERLPEVGEMVLIAYKISRKTYIARARMNKEGMFRFTKNTKPVTHWMPLPEPPNDTQKEQE